MLRLIVEFGATGLPDYSVITLEIENTLAARYQIWADRDADIDDIVTEVKQLAANLRVDEIVIQRGRLGTLAYDKLLRRQWNPAIRLTEEP